MPRSPGAHRRSKLQRARGRHRAEPEGFPLDATMGRALIVGGVLGGITLAAAGSAAPPEQTDTGARTWAANDLAVLRDERSHAAARGSRSAERTPQPATTSAQAPEAVPADTRAPVAPVAGLDQAQMDNAAVIVAVGRERGLPRRALIIGVATAMQESNLYNSASYAVPESLDYPHEGTSTDHDSVGIFQQRPSQGWGSVADLMQPAYQAGKFFAKLETIDWQNMSLTQAAQTVQVSAYPDAYAKHETRATTIVAALFPE